MPEGNIGDSLARSRPAGGGPGLLATMLIVLSLAAPAFANDFESWAIQRLHYHEVAGAAVAFIRNGQVTETLYLGEANTANATPVRGDTVFQVGSVSKPVAAWAVMTLVRDGRVDLDRPVWDYVTSWSPPESQFERDGVTVRRLLSHTAGLSLGGYPGFRRGVPLPSSAESLAGATNGVGAVFQNAPPGAQFAYSGGGYTLLQLMVEDLTGMPFDAYAEQAVLKPLGMQHSSYAPGPALLDKMAQPHGVRRDPAPHHDFRAQAAASLHATVSDMARFALANLQANPVLSPELVQLMHTPVADAFDNQIGVGFFISGGGALVGHGGSNLGWKADLLFSPADQSGLVVLTNSESGGAFSQDVICRWDQELGAGALSTDCDGHLSDQEASREQARWISAALNAISVALVLVAGGQLARRRLQFGSPGGLRWLWAAVALLPLTFAGLLYTPVAGYLLAGMWSPFATLDHLPWEVRQVTPAALGLLLIISAGAWLRRPAR